MPLRYQSQPRVATKYPRLASDFFRERGVNAEIIELAGSVELGPLVGLAHYIVDLVESGDTLRANGLSEVRVLMQSQAVLIANRAAYRLRSALIQPILRSLALAAQRAAQPNETRTP
jgi:ATP phosphoribosyltransferase